MIFEDARACSVVLKEPRRAASPTKWTVRASRGIDSLKTEEKTKPAVTLRENIASTCALTTDPTVHQQRDPVAEGGCLLLDLFSFLLRKEVIQPHLPVRLPCYDFTPITDPTFDGSFLTVGPPASGVADFRGVTGGVYKARERIHPGVLIRDY